MSNNWKTPERIQTQDFDCVPVALWIILAFYGKSTNLAEIRRICGTSPEGTTIAQLVKAAKYYNLNTQGHRIPPNKLEDFLEADNLKFPYLVAWANNHCVVVEKYSYNGDYVYINDPGTGRMPLEWEEFEICYSGFILELQPGESFCEKKPVKQKRFFRSILQKFQSTQSIPFLISALLSTLLMIVPDILIVTSSQFFIDNILAERQYELLRPFLIYIGILVVIKTGLLILNRRAIRRLAANLSVNLSGAFFWHILRLPLASYLCYKPEEISEGVDSNDDIAEFLSTEFVTLSGDVFSFLIYLVIIVYYSPLLAVVSISFPVVQVILLYFASGQIKEESAKEMSREVALEGNAYAIAENLNSIKMSSSEMLVFQLWNHYYHQYLKHYLFLTLKRVFIENTSIFLADSFNLVLLAIGSWQVIHGSLTIGMLWVVKGLIDALSAPMQSLVVTYSSDFQEFRAELNYVDDILETPGDLRFNQDVNTETIKNNIDFLDGSIKVDNLCFKYNYTDNDNVIENLSFEIHPGEKLLISGKNSSGKSTLVKLLTGLYTPLGGSILFGYNGFKKEHKQYKNIDKIDRSTFATSVGYVEHQPCFFPGTVRENLTLWNSSIPDAKIYEVCDSVCILERILNLENGIDSSADSLMTSFSGGEQQRLEIARVLIGQPKILIIDEGTSALDKETEQSILKYILSQKMTFILITHKTSILLDENDLKFDHVINLENSQDHLIFQTDSSPDSSQDENLNILDNLVEQYFSHYYVGDDPAYASSYNSVIPKSHLDMNRSLMTLASEGLIDAFSNQDMFQDRQLSLMSNQTTFLKTLVQVAQASRITLDRSSFKNLEATLTPRLEKYYFTPQKIFWFSKIRSSLVTLSDDWWNSTLGALIGTEPVNQTSLALLPTRNGRYEVKHPERDDLVFQPTEYNTANKQTISIDKRNSEALLLGSDAYKLHAPFPTKNINLLSFFWFSIQGKLRSIFIFIVTAITTALLSLLISPAVSFIIDDIIPVGNLNLLIQLGLGLTAINIGKLLLSIFQNTLLTNIEIHTEVRSITAIYDRVLSLWLATIQQYSPGDIKERLGAADETWEIVGEAFLMTLIPSVFSLSSFFLLLYYNLRLAIFAFVISLVLFIVTVAVGIFRIRIEHKILRQDGNLANLRVKFLRGLSKLKVAAVEERVFSRWMLELTQSTRLNLRWTILKDSVDIVIESTLLMSQIIIYLFAAHAIQDSLEGVGTFTLGNYLGFNVAFGIFSEGVVSVGESLLKVLSLPAIWRRLRPITHGVLENDRSQQVSIILSGTIKISDVSFSYLSAPESPPILNSVNLSIESGEYIGLMGASGAGKSTLMRLLLGFDNPHKGSIYYDSFSTRKLDLDFIRCQIGYVPQSTFILPDFSVYDAIVNGRNISRQEVSDILPLVGLQAISDLDIKVKDFSSGNKKKLLIARGLISKPKVLLLDEPTASLDLASQELIKGTLEKLSQFNVTRVVISHSVELLGNVDRLYTLTEGDLVQVK